MTYRDHADDLIKRQQTLDAKLAELVSLDDLALAAAAPFDPDGEWKGQGWITNARQWMAVLNAGRAAKQNPEFIAEAEKDARKAFHVINELREAKRRESPDEYARFIVEAGILADEARELID